MNTQQILKEIVRSGNFTLEEPCNCSPGQTLHNNGGNYHDIIVIKKISNYQYAIIDTDTCELVPKPPAQIVSFVELRQIISQALAQGLE